MEYLNPASFVEAIKMKQEYGKEAAVLAGGTDLLVRVKAGKEFPNILLDLNNTGLNYIKLDSATHIGAMTTLSEVLAHEGLAKKHPVLLEAAKEVGAVQTRTLATLVGNICTGIPSADMALPLLNLDTNVHLSSAKGNRVINLEDFFLGPRRILLEDNEIVREISIPNSTPIGAKGFAFLKVGKRKAMRLSVVSIALSLDIDPENNIINEIKIAMGTVAPIPLRLKKAEELMTGKKLEDELIKESVDVIKNSISPRSSLRASKEYRMLLAETLFKKALNIAMERALGRVGSND